MTFQLFKKTYSKHIAGILGCAQDTVNACIARRILKDLSSQCTSITCQHTHANINIVNILTHMSTY